MHVFNGDLLTKKGWEPLPVKVLLRWLDEDILILLKRVFDGGSCFDDDAGNWSRSEAGIRHPAGV